MPLIIPGTCCTCRDEVEDLCTAAVKEEQIEIKLRALGEQWGLEVFTFADHKQRGSVILKVCIMNAQLAVSALHLLLKGYLPPAHAAVRHF